MNNYLLLPKIYLIALVHQPFITRSNRKLLVFFAFSTLGMPAIRRRNGWWTVVTEPTPLGQRHDDTFIHVRHVIAKQFDVFCKLDVRFGVRVVLAVQLEKFISPSGKYTFRVVDNARYSEFGLAPIVQ